ncbi:MAG TPA: hypothetical protein VLR46_13830 [Candidatus Dormibacteraeota bacterium]|nr:hypothetical protein [Candidatus Dormibacteraeota bacterium]
MALPGDDPAVAGAGLGPLADPIQEGKRLVTAATGKGLTMRLLGGVAVYLQSPPAGPLLPRPIGDVDLATQRGNRRATSEFLLEAGYAGDEMFNVLHGARRLLFYDDVNGRKLDVFLGEFSMCHSIPIAERLERDPLTIPLAELLLTKLQIVELNERDQRDIYSLSYHHPLCESGGPEIEASFIVDMCAKDWGLWRTCKSTIEKCVANLGGYSMPDGARQVIADRLRDLWQRIEASPKSGRWKLRSRVGDRVRWYDQPEETAAAP